MFKDSWVTNAHTRTHEDLRYTVKWSQHSNQLTRLLLTHLTFVGVIQTPELYSVSKFPGFTVGWLAMITMLYTGSLNLLILHNCNFVSFNQHLLLGGPHHLALIITVLLSASMHSTLLASSCKWDHEVFFFSFSVWFILLSIMFPEFIHTVANGRIVNEVSLLKQHQNQASVITATSKCQGQIWVNTSKMHTEKGTTLSYPKMAQHFI